LEVVQLAEGYGDDFGVFPLPLQVRNAGLQCGEFLGQPPRYRGAGDREIYFKWTSRPVPARRAAARPAPEAAVLPILADYLEDAGFPRPRVVKHFTFEEPSFKLYFPVSY
jgi:hypothetical protein